MSKNGPGGEQASNSHPVEHGDEPPTLESLPPELRSQILESVGDLRTLRSFVRTSPTYHEQYRLKRDRLLQNCLKSELDGFYIDAHATLKSRVCELGQDRSNGTIVTFLCYYRRWRSGAGQTANIQSISPGETRWLSAFHLSVALPLVGLFCQWALANLKCATALSADGAAVELQETTMIDTSTLSTSELIRILRALYRCETYCHLFGRNKGRRIGRFGNSEITEIFSNIFKPWESEEVGCIDSFIRKRYKEVFEEVKTELHLKGPKFDSDGGGEDPSGLFRMDRFWDGEFEP